MSAPFERLARVRAVLARSTDPLAEPLAAHFESLPGDAWRAAWGAFGERARRKQIHPSLVLYVHVPFCARVCSYCLLAARKLPGKDVLDAYVDALVREIEVMGEAVQGVPVAAMHVGGGTPTVLSERQLDAVLGAAGRAFSRTEGFVAGIEAHPGSTTRAKLDVMARHGVSRVSFGVESFSEEVLAAVGRRDQTADRVARAVEHAREAGIAQVNVDLLAGLPGEDETSFQETVRRALDLPIDSMSVNRFLAEGSPLGAYGAAADEAEHGQVGRMLLDADRLVRERKPPTFPTEPVERPSFGTQYVWDPNGTARRYFQQDMIGPSSTLAVGHGGMGHVHGGAYAIAGAPLREWIDALTRGEAPPVLAWRASMRFEQAFYVADRAARGQLDGADFERVFGRKLERAFGEELALLERDGLLHARDRGWTASEGGASATELLCFLASEAGELAPRESATTEERDIPRVTLGPDAHEELTALAATGSKDVELDVSSGISTVEAQRLLDLAGKLGLRVRTVGADQTAHDQYARIGELPPSLVWCRLAIRAITALRTLESHDSTPTSRSG